MGNHIIWIILAPILTEILIHILLKTFKCKMGIELGGLLFFGLYCL